ASVASVNSTGATNPQRHETQRFPTSPQIHKTQRFPTSNERVRARGSLAAPDPEGFIPRFRERNPALLNNEAYYLLSIALVIHGFSRVATTEMSESLRLL
ncbi:hypothetical protein RRG08_064090, partial [Elysia crispata]